VARTISTAWRAATLLCLGVLALVVPAFAQDTRASDPAFESSAESGRPLTEDKPGRAMRADLRQLLDPTGTEWSLAGQAPNTKAPWTWAAQGEAPVAGGERAPPANNACSSAQVITGVGTWDFNNAEATQDGQSHFACNFFGNSQIDRDVWFRWTPTTTAPYDIETCQGAPFDTKIAVYTLAACPPGNSSLIGCNDDACSIQSRVRATFTAGQTYLIRVGVFPQSDGGAGQLRILFQPGSSLCTQPATNCQARTQTDAYLATGAQIADDFTPTTSGNITSVCFWGTYFDGTGDCSGVTNQFTIRYRFDDFGIPGAVIRQFTPGQYTLAGPVPTGQEIAGGFSEYAYTITHAAVSVSANQCYWIEIENNLTGACKWYWERGSGGNTFANIQGLPAAVDMAFCLSRPLDPATECEAFAAPSNDTCAGAAIIGCPNNAFVDTTFATQSTSDPSFTCRFAGQAPGFGSVWYRIRPSQSSFRLSMCESTVGDAMIAVYSGSCGALTQIACNDDWCSLRPQLCVTGVVPNQQYYVQIATRDPASQGVFELTVQCPCPAAPANDTCAGASLITLDSNGFGGAAGTTINATIDTVAPECNFSGATSPGVWYRVVGTGVRLSANLCTSSFDTKISVFCGTCTGLVCVGQNDDSEFCPPAGRVEWCAQAGQTYYMLVSGFDGQAGNFNLVVQRDTTVPCGSVVSCSTCNLTAPVGSIAENETCTQDNNGGCNSSPAAYQNISCGQTVFGQASAGLGVRDTDWYSFSVTTPSRVTWNVQTETPLEAFILNDQCFPDQQILAQAQAIRCGTATITMVLQPGTYRAFVAQIGDAYPCGSGSNDYIATLTCVPLGACCTGPGCTQTSAAECAGAGGTYGGNASACPYTYPLTTCSGFESIANTGAVLAVSGESGASADIGFTFRYFGVDHTSVSVSPNGYITFGTDANELFGAAFPSTTGPNAVIAPFWTNLAPEAGGAIRTQTLGTAPNRRFIVQWTAVPGFQLSTPNTFQAVLYETSGCVELRYQTIDSALLAGAFAGLEDHAGRVGTSVSPASGTCRRLCPSYNPPAGCSIAPCPGDANGNRSVTFVDITTVLANFGGNPPLGDANGDNQVSFLDITTVLANFGTVCP
jgi:hypothetical protein